ncbi:MAG TPA: pyridoxal phosphate-dependent aminotransferase [Bacteroidales bacterium]|jgi:dTDP-4-amino-4,6-dideoxygalactose transaminase|nr:pyridoxal phosphate-dependent aminotransferase [Bacteroidales bacterium]
MAKKIYLCSPHMGGGEMKYVKEAFDSNWVAPLGPNVDAFERELSLATGAKHVAALSSGTAAIHLALVLLGVKPGDYVIGTSFTFSATVNPIAYLGATPVLVDSEPGTWNMDPELLEQAIKEVSGKWEVENEKWKDKREKGGEGRIKAIVVVHLYGMPARMKEIMAVADRYGIPVVEDAAEALGSEYMGRRVGCNSRFGILSFNGNKIITTSGGGALLSDDAAMIERARFLATQARDPAPHYQHSVIGYNYRMSNVVAGVGRGQLEVLDLRIKQHREFNAWYRELLKDVPGVTFQSEPSPDFCSNFWLTCIVIDPAVAGTDREKLRLAFEAAGIESRPLWKPMHLQPVFAGCPAYVNGTSEKLFENGLCLPSSSNIDADGRARIAEVLKREFRIVNA